MKNWERQRYRLNTQILTKTEIALDLIRRREMDSQRNILHHPSQYVQFDLEQSQLVSHRALHVATPFLIHVAPYSLAYFSFDMRQHFFPLRVYLKQLSSPATLFVGYDRPHPGVDSSMQPMYHHRAAITQDSVLTLQNTTARNVTMVYLTVEAREALLALTLRIETNTGRLSTEPDQLPKNSSLSDLRGKKQQSSPLLRERQKSRPRLEQNRSQGSLKRSVPDAGVHRVVRVDRLEQILSKKRDIEESNEKQKQLREISSRVKRLIQTYREEYQERQRVSKRLARALTLTLFATHFVSRANLSYRHALRSLSLAAKVQAALRRFVRSLHSAREESAQQVPVKSGRACMAVLQGMRWLGRSVSSPCLSRAAVTIRQVFCRLAPSLEVNAVFLQARKFRSSVRRIQKAWLVKYRARVYSLSRFVEDHVSRMVREFVGLKFFVDKFQAEMISSKLVVDYMRDESMKFVHIHEAYLRKLEEIKEFEKTFKQEVARPNKKNKRLALELNRLPPLPRAPRHRFFRNTEILKAMVRSWFELEKKKWLKKHAPF